MDSDFSLGLPSLKLEDLVELVIDHRGKTPKKLGGDFTESGIPVISAIHIKRGKIIWEERERFVTQEMYEKWMKEPLRTNDVLLTSEAPLGEVALVPSNDPLVLSQRLFAIRTKADLLDPKYLLYFLQSQLGQDELQGRASGSTVIGIRQAELLNITVPCPELHVQKAVGEFLSVLDAKITCNEETFETLVNLAQAIFKSWFIDFDPVKAKMVGEKPEGMDAETAALFPDSMVESELGLIPQGWKVGTIKEICTQVVNGSTPLRTNTEFWNSHDVDWFKTGELADNFLFDSKESISQLALRSTSVKELPKGSVLMAIYAAPTVGRLGILTKTSTFNQACTGMTAREDIGTSYLYLTLFHRRIWFNSLAIGAAQQNISKSIVEECPCILASQDIHSAFKTLINPIFAKQEALSAENISLVAIRDALLPRLMSGELQMNEEIKAS
jgi:type I restriction enzyme S subunit